VKVSAGLSGLDDFVTGLNGTTWPAERGSDRSFACSIVCFGSIIRLLPTDEVRPEERWFGYPDRIASRCIRDGAIMGGDQAGGVIARANAQTLARLVEVGVDGVLGDAEAAGDLFGTEVLIDQAQAFALARSQHIER